MVKNEASFEEVIPEFMEWACAIDPAKPAGPDNATILVAHNAPFDTSFLNHEISRVYPGHRMINPHLCTVTLSRRAVPGLANYRLETVADHFAIDIAERHRAGSDALATAEVFIRILAQLEEHGVRDLAAARIFESPMLEPPVEKTTSSRMQFLPLLPRF